MRLRQERMRGPKSLKVNEYTTQLFHYGTDWRSNAREFTKFVEMTVGLLIQSDELISSLILLLPQDTRHDNDESVQMT